MHGTSCKSPDTWFHRGGCGARIEIGILRERRVSAAVWIDAFPVEGLELIFKFKMDPNRTSLQVGDTHHENYIRCCRSLMCVQSSQSKDMVTQKCISTFSLDSTKSALSRDVDVNTWTDGSQLAVVRTAQD
jgi:hypothetical protein